MNGNGMNEVSGATASVRAKTIASVPSQRRITEFLESSAFARHQNKPGICDFAFGNPQQMPPERYVESLRTVLTPRNAQWFAYKTNVAEARAAAAASLHRLLGLPFEEEDVFLTTGAFTAIPLALKAVADPGDEVIFSLPPWFFYEPLLIEAGLVPVKVRVDPETFDLDLAAIGAAVSPRTRMVIVNTPNNPTGRIYPPAELAKLAALLEEASVRNGRRIYVLSDEAYSRIVFDGTQFHSPAEFYPYTLISYTVGKTHLAPGQRIGYLALPPAMPERGDLREVLAALQMALGWIYPNALMQYALPLLEQFSIDIEELRRKRDLLVDALTGMGYRLQSPEGSFYLFVHSPIADDEAFVDALAQSGVFVLPGVLFETPGYFRISLTASQEMIERSLPVFAAAIARSEQANQGSAGAL